MSVAVGKDGIKLLPKHPLVWILLGYYLFFSFGCSRRPVLSHCVGVSQFAKSLFYVSDMTLIMIRKRPRGGAVW